MKSLVYHGIKDIAYETVADPKITNPGSAIVKISKCGICGSDLHPYHVGSAYQDYCIGHEAVGEVVEAGADVSLFKVGDRVFVAGSISCGTCDQCRQGLSMSCRNFPTCRVLGQGMHGLGGCQADALEVPAADFNLFSLPHGMSDALGIMLSDNLATGWTAAKNAGVRPGCTAAVIGLGAVGLQAALSAMAMGAERVFAIDLLEGRRATAKALGALPVISDNPLEEIRAATGGHGVDCMIDAVGIASTVELGMLATRRGGGMCVVGLPQTQTVPFPLITGIVRNIKLTMTSCSIQAAIPDLLDAIEAGTLHVEDIERLITHDVPLSQGARAYELFDQRSDGVIKLLMTPGA